MNIMFFLTPKSEVVYLYEDYSLRQALEKMEHYRFGAVPVLNRKGNYVGTLSEGDLLWNIKDKYGMDLHKAEEIPISSIERRWHNEPVNVGCDIEDLILTSMNQNFVPVIDDKKIFIGIITRKDIIQYCYNRYKEAEKSPEVPQNPGAFAIHR
ncbi:MAG: CBS domain-containing protein [Eubacteriales bacterium]|nr:CBS domain-containing protein [Eubacteriales bacterium]